MAKRKNHLSAFKAKVALEALGGESTLSDLAMKYRVHPNMITSGNARLLTACR